MKKITFLLHCLLLCCIGATAQTQVTEIGNLSNDKIYTLKANRGDGVGYLLYQESSAANNLQANYGNGPSDITYSLTEPAYQWAIYTSPKTGMAYFYSIAGNKFIGTSTEGSSKPVTMVDAPTNSVEVRTSSVTSYPFVLSTNQWALNVAGTYYPYGVVSWSGGYSNLTDPGNVYQITEAGDLDAAIKSNIAAKVATYESPFIYSLDELSNDKVYTLKANRGNGVGYLLYHATSAPDNLASNYGSGYTDIAYSAENNAYQWAIYKSAKTNKYYFYSVGGNKFIGSSTDGDSKAIALITNPTNDVEIRTSNAAGAGYPFVLATNRWALNAAQTNGCHGVVSWAGGYTNLNDPGNVFKITAVGDLTSEMKASIENAVRKFEDVAEVTFVYKIDGKEYKRLTAENHKGEPLIAVPAQDYLTIVGHDFTDATVTEDVTVNVTCEENLPFIASTNYDNATWYVVDIHHGDTGAGDVVNGTNAYIWTYNSTNEEIATPKTPTLLTELTDEMLWCFKGNLIDGFKIYNKAAGANKTIRKAETGNVISHMSETDDHNAFKLYLGSDGSSTCFKLDGDTYYLNKQDLKLKGYDMADGGSSCRFFTPAALPLKSEYVVSIPDGTVGNYSFINDKANANRLTAAIAAAKADAFNIDAAKALAAVNAEMVATPVNAIVSGKYYRILNAHTGFWERGKTKGFVYNPAQSTTNIVWNDVTKDNVNAIFQISVSGEGYLIKHSNKEEYLQGVRALLGTSDANTATFEALGQAQYKIRFSNGVCHAESHSGGNGNQGAIVAYDGQINTPSAWYIVAANDLEVNLNPADENTWATAYLPFGVSVPEESDLEIFTGTKATENEENVLLLTAQTGVPAKTGVVLRGTDTSYTLNIDDEATLDDKGMLTGTLVDEAIADKTSVYVLSNGSQGVGLYHPNTTTLAANKAYLEASQAQGINAFRFSFGEVTGIDGIESGKQSAASVYYDLSGRRVKTPAKGIYVKDGKKVIVK